MNETLKTMHNRKSIRASIDGDSPVPTRRVRRLLERWQPTGQERTWYPNGGDERAILFRRGFLEAPDEPVAIRWAMGLRRTFREIMIEIHDDELIVGEVGLEDVATTRPEDLRQAKGFWSERQHAFHRSLPSYEEAQKAGRHGLSNKWHNRNGHSIPAFDTILTRGLGGLAEIVNGEKTAAGESDTTHTFRRAMTIALTALSDYILRYAELAERKAGECAAETKQAAELKEIADTCSHLATEAPRTFREALQLVWFVHLGIKMDDGGVGHSFGRFDQYLYHTYRADIDQGRLTQDEAFELLCLFWIKLNREYDDIAHLSLGGLSPAGEDAVNELSFLCLAADRIVSRKQPNLSTRIHDATTPEYWTEISRTLRRGAGHPAIFNDEVIVPGLIAYGIPPEIARDYAQVGCVETLLPGLSAPWTDSYLNLVKCLELALHDGIDPLSGVRLGPATGDAAPFMTFDELFKAYEVQVKHALHDMLSAKDHYDTVVSEYEPEVLNSVFIHDCAEKGLDAAAGGARYLLAGVYGVGVGTLTDSLTALSRLIFSERLIDIKTMLEALGTDFRGHENFRSLCREHTPKYGNDDERADAIAVRVIESFGRQVKAYSESHHGRPPDLGSSAIIHYAMFGSVKSHTSFGTLTGATPDGRHAGTSLSDGGSPSPGCNRRGATAALRSLSKADYSLAPGGAAINLSLSSESLQGDDGLNRLTGLLKGYFEMGGEQLQVTVTDRETLKAAMREPEHHADLVVRVAGFTAYFVSLEKDIQEEILARSVASC